MIYENVSCHGFRFYGEMNGTKMTSQTFPNITGFRDFVKSRIPVMSSQTLFQRFFYFGKGFLLVKVLFHRGKLQDSWGILNVNLMVT